MKAILPAILRPAVFLTFFISACTPTTYEFTGSSQIFDMQAEAVGDSFSIEVHRPTGVDAGASALPTVYVMDGAQHALFVAGMAESLGLSLLVVGVGYDDGFSPERRRRDYTPWVLEEYDIPTGGAPAFRSFLLDELIPRIEAEQPASAQARTLFGHSLGGLFSTWFALTQDSATPTFEQFVSASPALFSAAGAILDTEEELASGIQDLPLTIRTSYGDLEGIQLSVYTATLAQTLKDRSYPSLTFDHRVLERTLHDVAWEVPYLEGLEAIYAQ